MDTLHLPLIRNNYIADAQARFWSRVEFSSTGCWLWRADGERYGRMCFRSKGHSTHRLAYYFAYGPIPHGLFVCHSCDNTLCVRPGHLFLGTAKQNTADMVRKGRVASGDRSGRRRYPESYLGERNASALLTEAQVLEIRAKYATGDTSYTKLGKAYKVSRSAVFAIVSRQNWAWLPHSPAA